MEQYIWYLINTMYSHHSNKQHDLKKNKERRYAIYVCVEFTQITTSLTDCFRATPELKAVNIDIYLSRKFLNTLKKCLLKELSRLKLEPNLKQIQILSYGYMQKEMGVIYTLCLQTQMSSSWLSSTYQMQVHNWA